MEDKRIAAEEILAEMVPMVTEEQERKRRQTESKKLTEENRKSTARAARPREVAKSAEKGARGNTS